MKQRLSLYSLLAFCLIMLAGCERYVHTPQCSELISAEPFPAHMVADAKGSVLDTNTRLRWYRCSAGQRFVNGQCIGDVIRLPQDQALAYAQEFSTRANQPWRLPTAKEMQSLTLSGCLNPVIHTDVFPGILVDNYWTSSSSPTTPGMGCTLYTFNGNGHCREVKTQARPFLLVLGNP